MVVFRSKGEGPNRKVPTLTTILVDDNVITQEQADIAHKHQSKLKIRLRIGEVLVRLGFCTTSDIDIALKKQCEISKTFLENGIHKENIEMVKSRVDLLDELMHNLNAIAQEARAITKKPSS